jgi:hypothetical protein
MRKPLAQKLGIEAGCQLHLQHSYSSRIQYSLIAHPLHDYVGRT